MCMHMHMRGFTCVVSLILDSCSGKFACSANRDTDDETPPYLLSLVLVRGKHIAIATVRAPVHSRAEELPSATMRTLPVC